MSCVYDLPGRKNLVCLYMHISPDCGDESQSHAFAGKTVYAARQIASSSSTIKHACCLCAAWYTHLDALGLVSMMLCYVTVKTVVSIDRIRMLKTDCSGETRLAPHVPSSLSWKAF